MTSPADLAGSAGGTLIFAGLAWLWTRNRANDLGTRQSERSTKAEPRESGRLSCVGCWQRRLSSRSSLPRSWPPCRCRDAASKLELLPGCRVATAISAPAPLSRRRSAGVTLPHLVLDRHRVVADTDGVADCEYPYVGSPRFWYRANKWALQHPYLYAAMLGAVSFVVVLGFWHSPITATVGGVLLFTFGSWNFTRGFGRRNLERRIRAYEASHGARRAIAM